MHNYWVKKINIDINIDMPVYYKCQLYSYNQIYTNSDFFNQGGTDTLSVMLTYITILDCTLFNVCIQIIKFDII